MHIPASRLRPVVLAGLALALAGLSLLWSREPHYDAWGWLSWGRELVTDPAHLATGGGGPSWKPLPVLVDALLAPLGAAAPAAWLVVVRTGGVASVALAYVLGARLGGRVAGVVAAGALPVAQGWWLALAWGASEPLVIALLLAALLAVWDGRHGWAQAALTAACLCRVEAWPFLIVHGLWAARRGALPVWAPPAIGLLLGALWFGPDWYSTGDPFHQSAVAMHSQEALSTPHDPIGALTSVAARAWRILPPAVWALAAAGLALGGRGRRAALGLAACALAWDAIVVVLTVRGFAGLGRFTLPAAAVVCVPAGSGASAILGLVRAPRVARVATAGVALAVLSFWLPAVAGDARATRREGGGSAVAALQAGVARFDALHLRRGPYATRVNGPLGTALAWQLKAPIGAVNRRDRRAGHWVVFQIGRGPFAGPPRAAPRGVLCRTLSTGAGDRVVLVARTRAACRRWLAA